MLRSGRALLLVLAFLSLQLSLVSGGDRCPVVNLFAGSGIAAGAARMSATDMGGMGMAGMGMAGMDMSSADHGGGDSADPSAGHDEQPCDTHGERTGCDSMTVCVFAAVIVARQPQNPPPVSAVPALAIAMRMPLTEARAPDHPPPKSMS